MSEVAHLSFSEIRSAAHDLAEQRRAARKELADRIAVGLIPETDCWIWLGGRSGVGYGQLGNGEYVHRHMYRRVWGPIPEGFVVHHTCETKLCVNPDHLRVMSRAKHMATHELHATDFCKRGHPFDEQNTLIRSDGYRECRQCRRNWQRANQKRRNAYERERRRKKREAKA